MIRIERLADENFKILASIEEGFVPPQGSIAIVASQDDQIVGRMLLVSMAHVEGTWVHEHFRNGTIAARMMREMEKQAASLGLKTIFAYAETEKVGEYIERLGYVPTDLKVFRKDL